MKICDLLKSDSKAIVQHVKTLMGREDEYSDYLYAIERSVAEEFLENSKLADKDVIAALDNVSKNLDKEICDFEERLEKGIVRSLIIELCEDKISGHELKLVFKYILWSIDNRSWLDDPSAYVKWLAHSMRLLEKKENEAYERKIRTLCRRKGIPAEQVEAMLSNNFEDVEFEDDGNSEIESRFFALEDDKKVDFVIENFTEAPFLFETCMSELMEKKDYEAAKGLCTKILEDYPGFPPVEIMCGLLHKEMGNTALARHHLENALKELDSTSEDIIKGKELAEMKEEIESQLSELDDG